METEQNPFICFNILGNGRYSIVANYDSSSNVFTGATGDSDKSLNGVSFAGNTLQATIINFKTPSVVLTKEDNNGNSLAGAEFKVEYEGLNGLQWRNPSNSNKLEAKSSGFTAPVDSQGRIMLDKLIPQTFESVSTVKLKFTETKAPEGYELLKSPIEMEFTYNPINGEINHAMGWEIQYCYMVNFCQIVLFL